MSLCGAGPRPGRSWAALSPLLCFLTGSSFTLGWAAKDRGELHRFLTQNLSLPNGTAELLLGSSVDLREVGDSVVFAALSAAASGGRILAQIELWPPDYVGLLLSCPVVPFI